MLLVGFHTNMNKRKLILIAALILGFVLFGLILAFILSNVRTPKEQSPALDLDRNIAPTSAQGRFQQDTTQESNIELSSKLRIIKATPSMYAEQVSPATRIQMEFNQAVTESRISIETFPPFVFTAEYLGEVVNIDPETVLDTGIQYEISVRDNVTRELVGVLIFTTNGDQTVEYPNTGPNENERTNYESVIRDTSPDVALLNEVPYENTDFSIDSDGFNSESETYTFTVSNKTDDPARAKDSFSTWIKSLGFTDDQIKKLQITYN